MLHTSAPLLCCIPLQHHVSRPSIRSGRITTPTSSPLWGISEVSSMVSSPATDPRSGRSASIQGLCADRGPFSCPPDASAGGREELATSRGRHRQIPREASVSQIDRTAEPPLAKHPPTLPGISPTAPQSTGCAAARASLSCPPDRQGGGTRGACDEQGGTFDWGHRSREPYEASSAGESLQSPHCPAGHLPTSFVARGECQGAPLAASPGS